MRRSHLSRLIFFCLTAALSPPVVAEGLPPGMRGDVELDAGAAPPPLAPYQETDKRRLRNYPEQPPTIPHSIDGYEISLRGNKCLSCHSRRRSVETGAPMISVSHFMDRDLQVLSDISPRRYFCNQCHVAETTVPSPVGNEFIDAAELPAQ